ncbi:MAG: threonine aldolase family protein [Acetobacteraceae bacterium]
MDLTGDKPRRVHISKQRVIDFRSDNVASVSPEIIAATLEANTDTAAPYGEDQVSSMLNDRFSEVFETKVTVFPIGTGTAANALSLSTLTPPYGAIYCHSSAHVHTSEAGATELLTGGAKLIPLEGDGFRLQASTLANAVASAGLGIKNRSQPTAVSITQTTEFGTVYSLDELAAIAEVARTNRLKIHMDGARLANALVTLGCRPAAATWRVGVDVLSFGCTKNGGLNADAIVVFNPNLVEDLSFRIRRSGHTWSKMRFPAAQLLAYVQSDLYLKSARRANGLAARLAANIKNIPDVKLVAPVEANELFLDLPERKIESLIQNGVQFLRRGPRLIRLVCRFDGSEEDVDQFIALLRISE